MILFVAPVVVTSVLLDLHALIAIAIGGFLLGIGLPLLRPRLEELLRQAAK